MISKVEVKYEKQKGKKRPKNNWIPVSWFIDINQFAEDIKVVRKWKASGKEKATFFATDPDALAFRDLRKYHAADGDGWCSFRAAVLAIEMVTGRAPGSIRADELIQEFQAAGVKRNPHRDEVKCGTKWSEVLAFIHRLCGKKMFKVKLDFTLLSKNRNQDGKGLDALARCKLEPGI